MNNTWKGMCMPSDYASYMYIAFMYIPEIIALPVQHDNRSFMVFEVLNVALNVDCDVINLITIVILTSCSSQYIFLRSNNSIS